MVTDPIADMLARIRNAASAHHSATMVPASRMKQALAQILKQEGYIADVRRELMPKGRFEHLVVALKYDRERGSAFRGMKRISRPGRRVYVRHDHIPKVLSGLGISILSTSQGIMTDREARRRKLGGELLCEVW